MPILFFTEGDSLFGSAATCGDSPRKNKPINLEELVQLTKTFWERSQRSDMPEDLKNKLLAGCRFPLKEVEMLIRQNPNAEYLQVNYAVEEKEAGKEKHFHYMVATTKNAKIELEENSLILEDCCRIPPNTATIASFF